MQRERQMMVVDDVIALFRAEDHRDHMLAEKFGILILFLGRLTPVFALGFDFPHADGDLGRTQVGNGDRRQPGLALRHVRLLQQKVPDRSYRGGKAPESKPPGAARHRAALSRQWRPIVQCASGSGRIWMWTAMGVMPLPPSLSQGVRSPSDDHKP